VGRLRTTDRKLPANLYCRNGYYSWRHPVTRRESGIGRNRAAAVMAANAANRTLRFDAVHKRLAEGLFTLLTPAEIVNAAIDPAEHSGIYFLIDGHEIVYVGQSENVFSRLAQHAREGVKRFNRFHWVKCHRALLLELEASYIAALTPRYNQTFSLESARRAAKLPENRDPIVNQQ
jgi:hypothetical protein